MHGGSAPQVRAAAQRRIQGEAARNAVVTYGLPREIDPADALLEEVWRTAGAVAWLEEQVRQLAPDELVRIRAETTKQATEERGEVGSSSDQRRTAAVERRVTPEANVWLVLFRDERDRLVRVCEAAIKAGIEERRVRLQQEQGRMVAAIVQAVLNDPELALDRHQREIGRGVAVRHLRVIPA